MKLLPGILLFPAFAAAVPSTTTDVTQKTFEASVRVTSKSDVVCDSAAKCSVSTNSRNVIFVRSELKKEELDFQRRGSFTKKDNRMKMKLDY